MLTLHEAIREIQHELLLSSQERIQAGEEPCFVTDKLTIELACTFSEKKSSKSNASLSILSVLTAGSDKDKDVSTDLTHKITLEFKTFESDYESSTHNNCDVRNESAEDNRKGHDSYKSQRSKGFKDKVSAIYPSDEV